QPFPDRISPLHGRIERAHARLVSMHKPPVDVHDQVAVLFVKRLQHGCICSRTRQSSGANIQRDGRVAGKTIGECVANSRLWSRQAANVYRFSANPGALMRMTRERDQAEIHSAWPRLRSWP